MSQLSSWYLLTTSHLSSRRLHILVRKFCLLGTFFLPFSVNNFCVLTWHPEARKRFVWINQCSRRNAHSTRDTPLTGTTEEKMR